MAVVTGVDLELRSGPGQAELGQAVGASSSMPPFPLPAEHSGANAPGLSCGELRIENELLWRKVEELTAERDRLREEVGQNSRNSSKPPSSDPQAARELRPRRKRSGRRPGKQPGSAGAWLRPVSDPDRIEVHAPEHCEDCGRSLTGKEPEGSEARQVFDLPPQLRLWAIEHRSLHIRCDDCGHLNKGSFPEGVSAPVQYGAGVYALGDYLTDYQLLPFQRTAELFEDVFGASISPGALVRGRQRGQERLGEFSEQVKELLRQAPVAQFDETGGRVGGIHQHVHSASTDKLTLYAVHQKRGREAMDAFGILPAFMGVAVHDCWAPYFGYDCTHALCNAHLLRELDAAAEHKGQEWASGMAGLLVEIERSVKRAKGQGRERLTASLAARYHREYDDLVEQGLLANPAPDSGRKRSKAGNLAQRLHDRKDQALRFMVDFQVPPTNNLAERDLRMVKLQQKISGGWRSPEGADAFLRMRSYISTVRKNRVPVMEALCRLFSGQSWLPRGAGP